MAKSQRGSGCVSGRRTGERTATRARTTAVGRSTEQTSNRLPFLLLQAVVGTVLLGFATALGSLPVLPALAFVLLVGGLTVLPGLADNDSPDRRRY